MNYDSEAILANPALYAAARVAHTATVVVDRNGDPVLSGVYDLVTTLIAVEPFGRHPDTGAVIQDSLIIQVVEERRSAPVGCQVSVLCNQGHDHPGECDPLLLDPGALPLNPKG